MKTTTICDNKQCLYLDKSHLKTHVKMQLIPKSIGTSSTDFNLHVMSKLVITMK